MTTANHSTVIIIGTGFSGIGMAHDLKERKIEDFIVLEKRPTIAGTWWENKYPGAECDVESHLYSFSFYPKYDWSKIYSESDEIQQYLVDCCDHYGITKHIRFGEEVNKCTFENNKWTVHTACGHEYSSQFLICSCSPLHIPRYATVPNMDKFKGETMHTSHWNRNYDFKNKTVAVIGNAASAIQCIPPLAQVAKTLYVFQRTPNWILPKGNRKFTATELWMLKNIPYARRLYAIYIRMYRDVLFDTFTPKSIIGNYRQNYSINYIKKSVGSVSNTQPLHMQTQTQVQQRAVQQESQKQQPNITTANNATVITLASEVTLKSNHQIITNDYFSKYQLHLKLIPTYPIGCKRILYSDTFLPTLAHENVHLIVDKILQFTETGIMTVTDALTALGDNGNNGSNVKEKRRVSTDMSDIFYANYDKFVNEMNKVNCSSDDVEEGSNTKNSNISGENSNGTTNTYISTDATTAALSPLHIATNTTINAARRRSSGASSLTQPSVSASTIYNEYPVDVTIFATGFDVAAPLGLMNINKNVMFNDFQCYYGIYVKSQPNLFLLLGPNAGSAHSAAHVYIEAQTKHIANTIQYMILKKKQQITVQSAVVEEYHRYLDARLEKFVWQQCNNFYLINGHNGALYPHNAAHFMRSVAKINIQRDFNIE